MPRPQNFNKNLAYYDSNYSVLVRLFCSLQFTQEKVLISTKLRQNSSRYIITITSIDTEMNKLM